MARSQRKYDYEYKVQAVKLAKKSVVPKPLRN